MPQQQAWCLPGVMSVVSTVLSNKEAQGGGLGEEQHTPAKGVGAAAAKVWPGPGKGTGLLQACWVSKSSWWGGGRTTVTTALGRNLGLG